MPQGATRGTLSAVELELEPAPPEPPPPPRRDVRADRAAHRRAERARRRTDAERRTASWRRFVPPMSRSFAISLGVHAAVFALLAILTLLRPAPVREDEVVVTIDLRSWVESADPEAVPGGTAPVAEAPQDADRGADLDAPGRLFDAEMESASIGAASADAGAMLLGRTAGREQLLQAGGGDGATEGAVRLALEWLARHQAADGTWDAASFSNRCRAARCSGPGDAPYVDGTTALALLPFLGAGHTHREGEWKDVVRRGLEALVARQRADGSFGSGPKRGYATAIGALALADAYGMTSSPALREPAQRAATLLVRTQSRNGGWRYEPGDGENDSSVTGWCVLALVSASHAGLDVPQGTLDAARSWYASVTDSSTGDVGYLARGGGSAALVGTGAFARVMLGTDPAARELESSWSRLETRLPRPPRGSNDVAEEYGVADPMHWYAGSLATFQRGGDTWRTWNAVLREALLRTQVRDATDERGSWAPFGATGRHGGRVVVTALCATSLEVYYRYPRAARR